MTEPIPLEVLVAARLKLKRRAAALIVTALAESGLTCEQVDTRLGTAPGFTKYQLNQLIDGSTMDLDTLSDLCCAMGFELALSLHHVFPAEGTTE